MKSFLSVIALSITFYSTTENQNFTWKQQLEEMINCLPLCMQDSSPILHEISTDLPFSSFTIGNHIFLSSGLRTLFEEEQRAIIGHELWHAVHGDTARQLKNFIKYLMAFALGYYLFTNTRWWSTCSWKLRIVLTMLSCYGTYALFHKYCVRPMELAADVASAYLFGNEKALVQMRTEDANCCHPTPWLFKLIAPFHPSSEEFLEYLQLKGKNSLIIGA